MEATMVSVTDRDTLSVTINGQPDTVRLYWTDAHEVQGCGCYKATNSARTAHSYYDSPRTIRIESDVADRDRYDRRLGYVSWKVGGQPCMLK
jgi:endonuclease YncB( thermonuclease family)